MSQRAQRLPAVPEGAVRVSVNATSANLGPGFDAMGLALDWADEVSAVPADDLVIEVVGQGSQVVPRDERHLVVKTMRRGLRHLHHHDPDMGVHLWAHNRIPHSRGLGSSAAAIAAGYGLAWGFARPGEELDRDLLLELVTADEGHPDNAAAVVWGGAVLAWPRSDRDHTGMVCLSVDERIRVRVWVPDHELPTALARQVLPRGLPRELVIAQAARSALLVHALSSRPDLLLEATQDWLHQQQRGTLMPDSLALLTRLRAAGVAAVVSGAGPCVLALGSAEQIALADQVPATGFTAHDLLIGAGMSLVRG